MSPDAAIRASARPLRVAIATPDPLRRIGLSSILADYGHALADSVGEADIVLTDGGAAPADGPPVIVLGVVVAGARGVLAFDADAAQIDAAIRAVAAGLLVRSPDAGSSGFEAMAEDPAPLMTPRELEILIAIGEGLSNKAIARKLGISPHTVKFHLESLFRKLGATNRAEAVAKGLAGQAIRL